jgi:hypothetical protein
MTSNKSLSNDVNLDLLGSIFLKHLQKYSSNAESENGGRLIGLLNCLI